MYWEYRRDKRDTDSAVHNLKGNGYTDNLRVDETAILKWDLVEIDMIALFIRLRTSISGGLL
jgi:hypothetical protein